MTGNGTIAPSRWRAGPMCIEGGTLAPGESVGTFTVTGAVAFEAGSHFAVELSGALADELLAADLDLTVSEHLDVSVLNPLTGNSWLIAEYSGVRNGEFDIVTPGYIVDYDTPGAIFLRLAVPGDYSVNGVFDAADFTVWRDSLDNEVMPGTRADGTGLGGMPDGVVDQLDYQFWKDRFGDPAPDGGGALAGVGIVPEPATVLLTYVVLGWLVGAGRKHFNRNSHLARTKDQTS